MTTKKKTTATTDSSPGPDTQELERLKAESEIAEPIVPTVQPADVESPRVVPFTEAGMIPCKVCGKKFTQRGMSKHQNQHAAAAPVPLLIPREVVKIVCGVPYHLVSMRYGPHWKLNDEEAESMVDAHLSLAQKYLPDWLKAHPEIYACVFCHLMVLFGKVQIQIQIEQAARAKKAAEKKGDTPKDGPGPDDSRAPWRGEIVHTAPGA